MRLALSARLSDGHRIALHSLPSHASLLATVATMPYLRIGPKGIGLSLFLLLLLPATAALAAGGPGTGSVCGEAEARYSISPAPEGLLSDYSNGSFRQSVQRDGDSQRVAVAVNLNPRAIKRPFKFDKNKLPKWLGEAHRAALSADLASCAKAAWAVRRILIHFRERLTYVEKADFEESPAEVISRGKASCDGISRLAAELLNSLGIKSRVVIGINMPPFSGEKNLQGGVLHAWIEVDYGAEGAYFSDPWRSVGWVPETSIFLGAGQDLGDRVAKLTGATLKVIERRDRVFYEPEPGRKCLLWALPEAEALLGTRILGKVLGQGDLPAVGRAMISGPGGDARMDLWEGNFFFVNLIPGEYTLRIEAPDVPAEATGVELKPMDKKRFLVYSRGTP